MEIRKDDLECGKEYYTEDGYLVKFIALSDWDIIVRYVMKDDDDDDDERNVISYNYKNNPVIVNKLFSTPPTEIREQKIEELDKIIRDKQKMIYELEMKIRENKEQLEKFKHNDIIKLLTDFESCTYIVAIDSYHIPLIYTIEEFMEYIKEDKWNSSDTFGVIKIAYGKLKLERYNRDIRTFSQYEEAYKFASEYFIDNIKNITINDNTIEIAKKYNYIIPQNKIIDYYNNLIKMEERELENRMSDTEIREKRIKHYQDKLKELSNA